jgi:AraC-like DNA-binding protein
VATVGGCADVEELEALVSSTLVPLHVAAPRDTRFTATVELGGVGPVTLARLRCTSHTVARERRSMTSSDRDLFKAVLALDGHLSVSQGGSRGRVRPGELVLFDTVRPYSIAVTGCCDVVIVGVPRPMLGASVEPLSRRAGVPAPLDTGTRGLVAAFFRSLGEGIQDLPGARGRHFADGIVSLLAAAFIEASPEQVDVGSDLADRVLAYAQANLGDPNLSVISVARAHGISPRHVHNLCASRGLTFSSWVRHERLSRIRRDLLDPALARRSVAAIAARWGLHSPSNLGRLLKAEFGQTATGIRRFTPGLGTASANPSV